MPDVPTPWLADDFDGVLTKPLKLNRTSGWESLSRTRSQRATFLQSSQVEACLRERPNLMKDL